VNQLAAMTLDERRAIPASMETSAKSSCPGPGAAEAMEMLKLKEAE